MAVAVVRDEQKVYAKGFGTRVENATPGTISKATFTGNRVTLEYYDHDLVGTFVR